ITRRERERRLAGRVPDRCHSGGVASQIGAFVPRLLHRSWDATSSDLLGRERDRVETGIRIERQTAPDGNFVPTDESLSSPE
ncbi:MAG: hypothetical protein ACREB9_09450, partial [Thermoplasmata archaeon]